MTPLFTTHCLLFTSRRQWAGSEIALALQFTGRVKTQRKLDQGKTSKVREADAVTIAQHFSAGSMARS
jgi:hypothetical protein